MSNLLENLDTEKFIREFQKETCLWDVRSDDYKIYTKKFYAFMKLAKLFNITVDDVKKKIRSLRNSFTRQLRKEKGKSGDGMEKFEDDEPPFYKNLLFLKDVYTPRETISNFDFESDSSHCTSPPYSPLTIFDTQEEKDNNNNAFNIQEYYLDNPVEIESPSEKTVQDNHEEKENCSTAFNIDDYCLEDPLENYFKKSPLEKRIRAKIQSTETEALSKTIADGELIYENSILKEQQQKTTPPTNSGTFNSSKSLPPTKHQFSKIQSTPKQFFIKPSAFNQQNVSGQTAKRNVCTSIFTTIKKMNQDKTLLSNTPQSNPIKQRQHYATPTPHLHIQTKQLNSFATFPKNQPLEKPKETAKELNQSKLQKSQNISANPHENPSYAEPPHLKKVITKAQSTDEVTKNIPTKSNKQFTNTNLSKNVSAEKNQSININETHESININETHQNLKKRNIKTQVNIAHRKRKLNEEKRQEKDKTKEEEKTNSEQEFLIFKQELEKLSLASRLPIDRPEAVGMYVTASLRLFSQEDIEEFESDLIYSIYKLKMKSKQKEKEIHQS